VAASNQPPIAANGNNAKFLDEVVIRLRVGDVVVDPDVGDEGVNSHFW
jgi:hypothetical protein